MVVGLLQKAGVDLHLAREHRLELSRHVVPGGDLLRSRRQLGIGGEHPQPLLPRKGLLAQLVPALVELPLVLGRPGGRDVVGCVRRAGRVVHEEGLVGDQRLLLSDPVDRAVGQILVQRVALLGRSGRLDRGRPFEEPRVVLVRLAADEAVEVLEARARRPVVEGAHRARLPHRDLVALAELRGRVPVQLQDLGERRLVEGAHAVVAGRGGRHLGDGAHSDGVVVAAGQQRGARRRAERGGVKAGVLEAGPRESFRVRREARSAERAGGAEPDVVEQDDEDVGRAGGRAQPADGRVVGRRILGVEGGEADVLPIGDRESRALNVVVARRPRAIRGLGRRAVGLLHRFPPPERRWESGRTRQRRAGGMRRGPMPARSSLLAGRGAMTVGLRDDGAAHSTGRDGGRQSRRRGSAARGLNDVGHFRRCTNPREPETLW